jgi:hypothetical protein
VDFADSLEQLEITIGDSASVTFTPEEKERALQKAWNDGFVVNTVRDDTLTWATDIWTYAVPIAVDTVKGIYIQRSNYADDPIDSDLYEVTDGDIIFRQEAANYFIPGDTIVVKGNYKLDYDTDTLDTENLQEYVIASAGYHTLTLLTFKKANLFLKNDVSMSELITLRRELDAERKELRGKLQRAFEDA